MGFLLVQILWWLSVSTWFGGVLFIAVSAPLIFRTVRESDPILPTVLSVNLEGQHGTLLAGTIVADLLVMLARVELLCAAGVVVAIIGRWVLDPANYLQDLILAALFIGAGGLVLYDRYRVAPQVQKYRREYLDHADDPDLANPAKEQFDRYHNESVTVLMFTLALLLGMILFSAGVKPVGPTQIITAPAR